MDIDLQLVFYHFYQLGIAFVLSLPIAYNREHKTDGAGLRTLPLVAISACAFMLVGREVYQDGEAEARVMYGIITGIGFIGGGAILKNSKRVAGTATAAGIWLVGALGVTVAYGRYEISIVLCTLGFIIFQFAGPMKKRRAQSERGE